MTQIHLQMDVGQWVINFAFWVCLAFPIVAATYWPWWRDWWGWSIATLELLIPVALAGSVLQIDFGLSFLSDLWFGWVVLVAVGLIPVVAIQRLWLIWRRQTRYVNREDLDDPA